MIFKFLFLLIFSSTEERKTYEESEGYKSFGRQCMEIYNNINPEEFKSMEEIKSFVAANSEYLQLIEEENGDLTLEIALFRNPNRYLLNKDRMFQVGNRVYKAFEGATVSSEPKNTAILKDLGQNSLIPYEKNHEFQIDYIKNKELFTGLAKNDEENCGVSASEEADIHYIYTGVGTPRR